MQQMNWSKTPVNLSVMKFKTVLQDFPVCFFSLPTLRSLAHKYT